MNKERDFLDGALHALLSASKYIFLFSIAINIIMLAIPIYTLQVLDRVVGSGSIETLVMLSIIAVFVFIVFGLFNAIRSIFLIKIGEWFDHKVSAKLFSTSVTLSSVSHGISGSQNLRDLGVIKSFITGNGITAIIDAPFAFLFIIVLFFIHPVPALIAIFGGVVLFAAAYLNERVVKNILIKANDLNIKSLNHVETSTRNAEVIEAMGMMNDVASNWRNKNTAVIEAQTQAASKAAMISSFAKAFRLLIQVVVIGAGAALFLSNQITVGAIIAGSILVGRALSPFEQAIGAWSSVKGVIQSYKRIKDSIIKAPIREQVMELPSPEGHLSIEKVLFAIPGTNTAIIKGIGFQLAAGEMLGVIGPSASGKSTLAKLLVGVYRPMGGNVRLDGADVYSWNREHFGKHVGYLPQDIELFNGTVKENIARMRANASDDDVIKAAQLAGVHDMILRLPNGYDTQIGVGGSMLSAGQRQRIGLARSFFGDPKLLILDEPNSNLDDAGEHALALALKNAKALKMTVVIIAHRQSVLSFVDKIMIMKDGMIADFGPAKDILSKYSKPRPEVAQKKSGEN